MPVLAVPTVDIAMIGRPGALFGASCRAFCPYHGSHYPLLPAFVSLAAY